jgi:hypothetical protein
VLWVCWCLCCVVAIVVFVGVTIVVDVDIIGDIVVLAAAAFVFFVAICGAPFCLPSFPFTGLFQFILIEPFAALSGPILFLPLMLAYHAHMTPSSPLSRDLRLSPTCQPI